MPGEHEAAFVPISALVNQGTSGLDRKSVAAVQEEIRSAYAADDRPWVIGYSGGKDSTATLQIVWYALAKLPAEKRVKPGLGTKVLRQGREDAREVARKRL